MSPVCAEPQANDRVDESLAARMKRNYEDAYRLRLPLRMPIILRVDGRAFHTFCDAMDRPFDERFIAAMNDVAHALVTEIAGAELAYLQSDEISLLVHNYKRLKTEAWLDGNLQKTVSLAAGIASAKMNRLYADAPIMPVFDARAFVVPEREVNNYFVWRQQDWERNSLGMLARSRSDAELRGKRRAEVHEMLFRVGLNWARLPSYLRRGRALVRSDTGWALELEPPRFRDQPEWIERVLEPLAEE